MNKSPVDEHDLSLAGLTDAEREKRARLIEAIKRQLGPAVLTAIEDPDVFEVLLTRTGEVWTDSIHGGLAPLAPGGGPCITISPSAATNMMWTLADLLDTVVNKEAPILEGEFPLNGERFEGLLPPIVQRPIFAMRKLATSIFTLDDYVRKGVITLRQVEHIHQAIRERKNILIVGGTSSGKTTLVNALLDAIADLTPEHRILIMEDTRELQCRARNVEFLRTTKTVSLKDLLRASLRLRPDRLFVGEVRGEEALFVLKAWNTGHPGGGATIHADGAIDGLFRLDELLQEAGVPSKLGLIGRAVDLVLFISKDPRAPAGRALKEIIAVDGYDTVQGKFLVHNV